MIVRTLVIGPLASNCYIIADESTKAAAVIDPGDEAGRIEREIRELEIDLRCILLTHGHADHSFVAGELQQTFDVDVLMHQADVPQLEGEKAIIELFYDLHSYIKPRLGRFLSEGDTIAIGETVLRVIHTPGHTPGGLCFIYDDYAFTGDTLFAGGIGRTDLTDGSQSDIMRSIHDKLLTLPDATIIYPGHGPSSTIGDERDGNPWVGER